MRTAAPCIASYCTKKSAQFSCHSIFHYSDIGRSYRKCGLLSGKECRKSGVPRRDMEKVIRSDRIGLLLKERPTVRQNDKLCKGTASVNNNYSCTRRIQPVRTRRHVLDCTKDCNRRTMDFRSVMRASDACELVKKGLLICMSGKYTK